MTKLKVVKYQVYRDGGTTEYRDEHNRQYFIAAPRHKDNAIYCVHPQHVTKSDEYRNDIRLKDIELEIVESF